MSSTVPPAISAMITGNPKLNNSNWFEWKKKMKMVFMAVDLMGIASGSKPTESADLERWSKLNRVMTAYIYMAIEDEYQYLIEDEETAETAWKTLESYFQRSTIGHRINARRELYEIAHDPSLPISLYIQSLTAAKRKLIALGCNIEDTEFKDVLLMHLDPSFHTVRTSILAQKDEPSLDDIKAILMSSATADLDPIKMEPMETALKTQDRFLKKPSPTDEKGFRWCDTTNEDACHRCGRPNHIAARCMFNMPQSVKDWISSSRPSNQSTSQAFHTTREDVLMSSSMAVILDVDPNQDPFLI